MIPLELGLAPWALDQSGANASLEPLTRQCERAEQLGYHSAWIPESHFAGRGATPAPLLLLTAIAARTTRLRLGTTSYLLPIRHPLHVAAEVAVLDRLSKGRVILGVGRGFRAATFDAFKVPRGEKRDLFEAALETMQRAWRGEPIAADGEASITLSPLPVQEPHPPVWVAAFGPKALAQAGRLGLPYLASPMESRGRLAENYAAHREACPDPSTYEDLAVPIMRTVFITQSKEVEERVRTGLQAQIAALRGTRPRREEGVEVDDFALVGEPERVADEVARYREELGMTHLIARAHLPDASPEEVDASIALLAELCQRHGV